MLNILQILSAGSAVFLAFITWVHPGATNKVANRWLAFFLFLLGIFQIDDAFLIYGIYEKYPHIFGYIAMVAFSMAPTLYLAVSRFVAVNQRFSRSDLWHFAPFALYTLLHLPFFFAATDVKLEVIRALALPENQELTVVDAVVLTVLLLQTILYWLASLRAIYKHRQNIQLVTSAVEAVRLDWLLHFVYVIGVIIGIWMLDIFTAPEFSYHATYAALGYLLGAYWLAYFVLRQKEVYPFTGETADQIEAIVASAQDPIQQKRQIFDEKTLEILKAQLKQLMETQKPFLNNELNLPELARMMDLSTHEMSHLMNEGFSENFYQFVNRYRVAESCRLLHSQAHSHLSMVGIAFESGFNSKTVFNTTFKKVTGHSPSAYRLRAKEESVPILRGVHLDPTEQITV